MWSPWSYSVFEEPVQSVLKMVTPGRDETKIARFSALYESDILLKMFLE